MTRHWKLLAAAALAAPLAVSLATGADAQSGQRMRDCPGGGYGMMQGGGMYGGGMYGGGMMGRHGMGRGGRHGMGMGMGPGAYIDGRLAFQKTELHITDAQEDAWNAYADAARQVAESMQSMHEAMMSEDRPDTLPERLARREQHMSARLEAMRTLSRAIGPLYDALDDEQKRVADDILGIGRGMM